MNLNKYDQKPTEPALQPKPPLQDWTESVPVVLLSEALKIVGKEHGMRLVAEEDGEPVLSINPGLRAEDIGTQRWHMVEQVAELFLNATADLKHLLAAGKLQLPAYKAAGPSRQI